MHETHNESMTPLVLTVEQALEDTYSRRILNATTRLKTISDISKECKIPINTTYRRIRILRNLGFLEARGFIIDGVRFNKYKRNPMFKYGQYNPRVKKILEVISLKPGLCYSELQEDTGLSNGTLSHYISNMAKDSKIIVKRTKRRTWFFLPQTTTREIDLIINLRKETSKNILSFLLLNGSSVFRDIRNGMKKSPATISLTLTHLVEIGIVKRISGIHPKYELTDRDLTFNTIKKIEPNLSDTLEDRFADTFSYF